MDSAQQRRSGRRSRPASEDEPVADRFAFNAGSRGGKSTAKKSTAKKSTAKTAAKPTAKKSTAKATTTKTTAKTAAKPTAKKSTAKATTTTKTTAKTAAKPTAKKTTAKAATAKKSTAKAPAAKKTTAKAPTARARTRAVVAPPAPPAEEAPPEPVEPVSVTEAVAPGAPTVEAPAPVETPSREEARPAPPPPAPPSEEGEAPRFAAATRGRPAVPAPPAPPSRAPAPAPTRPEPIGPTPAAYRRRRTALAVVGLAVVGALVWAGVYFTGGDDDPSPTPPGSVVSPTGSPNGSPTGSPTGPVGPVATAAFPGEAVAEGASMQVVPLAQRDQKCKTHTFGGTSAYLSDCTDWEDRAGSLYFFYVTAENTSDESLTLRRSAFIVTTATGTLEPVGVAGGAVDPTTFIPKSRTIDPQGALSGYIVFETDQPFSPDQLSYQRGGLSLTITFEGPENVRPRA